MYLIKIFRVIFLPYAQNPWIDCQERLSRLETYSSMLALTEIIVAVFPVLHLVVTTRLRKGDPYLVFQKAFIQRR